MKSSMVRLPDEAATKIEQYGKERGIAFATAVRCMIIDHLKETYPNLMSGKPEELKQIG